MPSLRVERVATEPGRSQARFVFDVGSPESWLVAERVLQDLPELAEWWPVHGADLALGALDRAEIERRAADRGLLAPRWPERSSDTRRAMLAAVYAKQIGKTVAFCLAAFRQAYAGGRDPGDEETFLLAGAAAEMHPAAIVRAIETRGVSRALDAATAFAVEAGVGALPAIVTPAGEIFTGDDGVEVAAAALAAAAT
ncbi:MAG: 2-hydroxychromene-2-carboxylate isomerase-like protein [Solirubrobacterales bacterium]|nr:2-hydroxychromene-2-carboxylate isomerase-like protein [Solirubrobacterales bacterium]